MAKVTICVNCLTVYQGFFGGFPVGHEKGTQRDPYQTLLDLCADCAKALEKGDMATFHDRYNPNPTVTVASRP